MMLEKELRRKGLKASTRAKYSEILEAAPHEPREMLAWAHARLTEDTPIGTVLPTRAAVKHYLVLRGYTVDELDDLLPEARGAATRTRYGLTAAQLELFLVATTAISSGASRTILQLVPFTGLRISEACDLQFSQLELGQTATIRLSPSRVIPVLGAGRQSLLSYLGQWSGGSGALFPVGPQAVRKYTRLIAATNEELAGLTPMVLRHTYGQMCLAQGVPLPELQRRLGLRSVTSASRYITKPSPTP
jgi:integrase